MRAFAASGAPFDITAWFAYTTFDIIGAMALGSPFGCLTDPTFHFWVPLISSSIAVGALEQATRRIFTTGSWAQKALLKLVPASVRRTRRQHLEYSREKILKRMGETGSQQRDFLYYLMKQREGGALSEGEIVVNGALFIIAGTETTAGFLSGLFNQLLRPQNADVLERLTREIREAFEREEDIVFEELVKLPYLSAVIEEGLRIYPSAPIGFTRTVPEGGDTVDGEYIPGGVSTVSTVVTGCSLMFRADHGLRLHVGGDAQRAQLPRPLHLQAGALARRGKRRGQDEPVGRQAEREQCLLTGSERLYRPEVSFAPPLLSREAIMFAVADVRS